MKGMEEVGTININNVVLVLEVIGTIAFSSSGTMVGIRKKMDIFGVIVMAVTTAVGGGIIRDIILGCLPPAAFLHPIYVMVAILCSVIMFVMASLKQQIAVGKMVTLYDKLMIILDAVGLGVFTVIGIEKACENGYKEDVFLVLFVGIVTGVGGGVLRDIMAQEMPFIFVKHIYACASLSGAVFCILFMPVSKPVAMVGGTVVVIMVRLFAAKYRWNLPRIK